LQETPEVALKERADRVVLLDGAMTLPDVDSLLQRLTDGTAEVAFAWTMPRPPGFPEPGLRSMGDFAIAYYWDSRLRGARATFKRGFDAMSSAALLILLSPLYLLIAIVVRCSSAGPILHGQIRVGLDGRTFTMWKFRTMITGAEDASGPVFATPNDPRRTPVGAFLRRFSLDELPQIWNVLRGDMSLVGPRPERPEFVEGFRRTVPGYMLRHSLKAGVTGLAQVHGLRGRSSIEDRLAYDLEYARRWSFLLDIEILVRTVAQVVAGRNAY
jgi:exopolysaccharide biosynthesis polyprenyl glycosylphosphotransferase